MREVRFCMLFSVAVVLTGLASATSAGASTACSSRLLADWRDGRIDGTYPVHCYREALASLPEDVRVYSTAEADITRALQSRLRTGSARMEAAADRGDSGGTVSPLVVVAITGGLLLGAASVAALIR
jgi:hypothetical protein